jgi:hypothetical protein
MNKVAVVPAAPSIVRPEHNVTVKTALELPLLLANVAGVIKRLRQSHLRFGMRAEANDMVDALIFCLSSIRMKGENE